MKKIVLLTRSLSQGGAEKVLSLISVNLSREYDKTIVVYDDSRIDYEYDGRLFALNANIAPCLLLKFKTFFQRVKEMKTIKNKHGVDVSISFQTLLIYFRNLMQKLSFL